MTNYPLVVDLDHTLSLTDTLHEIALAAIKKKPIIFILFPIWLMKGRAYFKDRLIQEVNFSAENLPYNAELLAYIKVQKDQGRSIILATAANKKIADAVSMHLGLFDNVLASNSKINLKGSVKLEAIRQFVSPDFVYAGDSNADLPIWKAARAAILVNTSAVLSKQVRDVKTIEKEFHQNTNASRSKIWLKAIRIHQWLKNLLLFVPLLTAFSFTDIHAVGTLIIAFLSFSLAASGTYIINDLWDLESDRAHPRKCKRAFASGDIRIVTGAIVAMGLIATGFALGSLVSISFLAMLLLYWALTTGYSLVLKELVLIDVITLSLLYTLRIIAGGVAANIEISSWLLAFSVFVFLSLALVKRCAELVALSESGKDITRGRDYRVSDLSVLWPLGVGSAMSAVVVFGLFINAVALEYRYATPELLWLSTIGLIYWLSRLWIKTSRGEMHDDPVFFAMKDKGSRFTIAAMILIVIIARLVPLG